MTEINYRTFRQREILVLVLVGVFVVSVIGITISIFIIHPPGEGDDSYSGKTNILFIVVDDLRPALGCYGDEIAVTPNIDQLASKSILFKHAYSQQALDAPSRISFLTSRRPDSLHLYDNNGSYWRHGNNSFITLPQHFKAHGYETISVGKIFHHGTSSDNDDDYDDSWSVYPYHPSSAEYKVCPSEDGENPLNLICPVDISNPSVGTLPDIESTEYAIDYLRNRLKGENRTVPFFLGVGYYKPHIPFKFPREYLDLYPIESFNLTENHRIPPRMPKVAWNPWVDVREMDDIKNLNISFPFGLIPEDFQKLIRQSYYASLSYIDDQLGKLLKVLEETGYAAHTTIVLLGDNGWSLGEHGEWSKYSNFDVSLKVPLIVHIPDFTEDKRIPFKHISVLDYVPKNNSFLMTNIGWSAPKYAPNYVTDEIVELVDVFPSLAEIANIAVPPLCRLYKTNFCSEGLSFYPLIEHVVTDPWVEFSWKRAAFSQYPRPSLVPQYDSDQPKLDDIVIMGYSVRNHFFRYTEWVVFDNDTLKPDWAMIISRELYDHRYDAVEMNNLCDEDLYANTVIELSKAIKKGWRHAMPPGLFDGPRKHIDSTPLTSHQIL